MAAPALGRVVLGGGVADPVLEVPEINGYEVLVEAQCVEAQCLTNS